MTAVTTYYCDDCNIPFKHQDSLVTYGIHHYCFQCATVRVHKMLTESISRIEKLDFSHDPRDRRYYTGPVATVEAIYNATQNIERALDEYEGVGE